MQKFVQRKSEFDFAKHQRPFITLSYAQTLDGSISLLPCQPVQISANPTLRLTHKLRAENDGILIGIGTLISDDPLLNVRYVEGKNPRPIIVDSHLRFPPAARMIQNGGVKPWVAATCDVNDDTEKMLLQKSIQILHFNAVENGWVNLSELVQKLYTMGIHSLMIEGGSRIITSFLKENLVDQIIVTVAPMIIGGFRAVGNLNIDQLKDSHKLSNPNYYNLGDDLVVRADISGSNR